MLFFLYSIHFSPHSSSFPIVYCITIGRAEQVRAGKGVTGPTRAGTATRDSNEGQDRGAGGREEEGDGWAGVLGGGGSGGAGDRMAGRAERGT